MHACFVLHVVCVYACLFALYTQCLPPYHAHLPLRRLLEYNQHKMPFAASQIGLGFRNEIAPRNGLLRVREFCMAEIEHFVHPNDKSHPKFGRVADKALVLFSSEAQLTTGRTATLTAGQAVRSGLINNETLAYFMTRTQLWLESIGVEPSRMRLRQHLKTEMAHYAADCWDMEILMSYGWIECVGHADRACYDLEQHSRRTGVPMVASERLPEPISVERVVVEPNKKLIGPRFKLEQKAVTAAIEALEGEELDAFKASIEASGMASIQQFTITADLVSFSLQKKTIVETKYTPSVIEPSYGIGRILYAVLEHSFSRRDGDEQRCVMAFRPSIAPIQVGIFRLINHDPLDHVVGRIKDLLHARNINCKVDSSSGSVGRRYARADELGIPFGITVDFQSLLDGSVTLRDRDSTNQVRVPYSSLLELILQLVGEAVSWSTVMERYVVVKAGGFDGGCEEDPQQPQSSPTESAAATVVQYSSRGSFSRPNPNAVK